MFLSRQKPFRLFGVFVSMAVFFIAAFFILSALKTQAMMIVVPAIIKGVVTDADSNEPLSDVLITIYEGNTEVVSTTTGADGRYQVFVDDYSISMVSLTAELENYNTSTVKNISICCFETDIVNVSLEPESPALDPVILIPGTLGSWNLFGRWELDPLLHTYDDLWSALQQPGAGYVPGETLFGFPYQWRVSNELTAYDLMHKIDQVQTLAGAEKVDIIAHSMGGLVTRYYIENELYLQDDDGIDDIDIDQVIFLGTPHQGATKSYLTWEAGEVGVDPNDFLAQRIFSIEANFNGFADVFDYIRNLPVISVQQLLPIFDYLKDKDSGLIRTYPDNYPANVFLDDLNSADKLAKLNQVRGLNIIGKIGADSTIDVLRVVPDDNMYNKWEHGYPEKFNNILFGGDHGLEYGEGDGTVPNRSNNHLTNFPTIELNYDHSGIVTEAQTIIIKELTGFEPVNMIRENIFTKWLLIRVFSPVDFQVINPNGLMLGKDFNTNQSLNQIPAAFYSGFDQSGPEFALIPDPVEGDYQIIIQGTDVGLYDVGLSYIGDDQALDEFIYQIPIKVGEQDRFDFELDPSQPEVQIDLVHQNQITPTVLIQTIKHCYQTGNISKKAVKNSLIKAVKTAEIWYNLVQTIKSKLSNQVINNLIEYVQTEFLFKLFKFKLNYYLNKGRLTTDCYYQLLGQVNYIIINLNQ